MSSLSVYPPYKTCLLMESFVSELTQGYYEGGPGTPGRASLNKLLWKLGFINVK